MEWHVKGMFGVHDVDLVITAPDAPVKAKRTGASTVSSLSVEQVSQEIERIRVSLPGQVVGLADEFARVFAESNKSGKVRESRLLRDMWLPLEAASQSFSPAALAHGLQAAIGKGAANMNYVKRAAEGFEAPAATATTTIRRRVLG